MSDDWRFSNEVRRARFGDPKARWRPARVRWLRQDSLATIVVRGSLDRRTYRGLAEAAEKAAGATHVALVLRSRAGERDGLSTARWAVESLARSTNGNLLARIEAAIGPGLILAAGCGFVEARPLARIGLGSAWSPDGNTAAAAELLRIMGNRLAELRTGATLPRSAWLSGEAAEAAGLVDWIRTSLVRSL